jgi:hypothetical protein
MNGLVTVCFLVVGLAIGWAARWAQRHRYWDTLALACACAVLLVVLGVVLGRRWPSTRGEGQVFTTDWRVMLVVGCAMGTLVGMAVGRAIGLATHPRTRSPAHLVGMCWALFTFAVWEWLLYHWLEGAMPNVKNIAVQSLVGGMTGQPAVMLRVGEEFVNMPPSQARKVSRDLMECAYAAELDAKLVGTFRKHGMSEEAIAGLLATIRAERSGG